jgi:hypothetical protein
MADATKAIHAAREADAHSDLLGDLAAALSRLRQQGG